MSRGAMGLIVSDCHARVAEIVEDAPCTALRVLGRQRILLQKSSKQACLQGLAHETGKQGEDDAKRGRIRAGMS